MNSSFRPLSFGRRLHVGNVHTFSFAGKSWFRRNETCKMRVPRAEATPSPQPASTVGPAQDWHMYSAHEQCIFIQRFDYIGLHAETINEWSLSKFLRSSRHDHNTFLPCHSLPPPWSTASPRATTLPKATQLQQPPRIGCLKLTGLIFKFDNWLVRTKMRRPDGILPARLTLELVAQGSRTAT